MIASIIYIYPTFSCSQPISSQITLRSIVYRRRRPLLLSPIALLIFCLLPLLLIHFRPHLLAESTPLPHSMNTWELWFERVNNSSSLNTWLTLVSFFTGTMSILSAPSLNRVARVTAAAAGFIWLPSRTIWVWGWTSRKWPMLPFSFLRLAL